MAIAAGLRLSRTASEARIDAAQFFQRLARRPHQRQRRFGRIVQRRVGGVRRSPAAGRRSAARAARFRARVLAGCERGAFDFLALELHRSSSRSFSCSVRSSSSSSARGGAPARDRAPRSAPAARDRRRRHPACRAAPRAKTAAADRAGRGYRPGSGASSLSSATATGRLPTNARDLPPARISRSISSSPSSTSMPAGSSSRRTAPGRALRRCRRCARALSPVRIISADARPPNSSPSASTTIDLPLPVSPVSRFRPG